MALMFRALRPRLAGALTGLLVALTGCGVSTGAGGSRASPAPAASVPTTPAPSPAPTPPPDLPPAIAAGQLVVVSFDGTEITAGLRHLIVDDKVGAVLLFSANFPDAAGLRQLVAELRDLAAQARLPAPLLVMLDQEGGRVARVRETVPQLPSQQVLGRRGLAEVRTAYAGMGRGLSDLGVGCDLAPVADLRTNPADTVIGDRSFGSDPSAVAPLVSAAVSGLHDGGEAATLKHFPGLGGQVGDPHATLTTDPVSLQRWRATQALSFRAGIDAGADLVMSTAIAMPGLDPSGVPALFSPAVVTGLLRRELGFDGVIVTDSLTLRGVSDRYPLPDATIASFQAGNDLAILGTGSAPDQQAALDALTGAIAAGRLPAAGVRQSVDRVLGLRQRFGRR